MTLTVRQTLARASSGWRFRASRIRRRYENVWQPRDWRRRLAFKSPRVPRWPGSGEVRERRSDIGQLCWGEIHARSSEATETVAPYCTAMHAPYPLSRGVARWCVSILKTSPNAATTDLFPALDIPDLEDTTGWKFQNLSSWWGPPYAADLKDPAVRVKFIKERIARFPDPFRTAWLAVSDDAELPIYSGQQWAPTMTWDNYGGKVTLAGDAAHSMLPREYSMPAFGSECNS